MKKKLLDSVALLLSIAFSIFLLEAGSYVFWKKRVSKRRDNGVAFVLEAMRDTVELNSCSPFFSKKPNPYSLFWNNPVYRHNDSFTIYNSFGHRNNYESDEKCDFKILVLGESTTNCYPYIHENNKIWTYFLEQQLKAYYHKDIRVINAGLSYGTSAELFVHYAMTTDLIKPNMVIYHGGGNDPCPALFENYRPDYSTFRQATIDKPRPFEKELIRHSYFFKCMYANWLKEGGILIDQPYSWDKLDRKKAMERIKVSKMEGFSSNLQNIIMLVQQHKQSMLLVGFLHAKYENICKNRADLNGLTDAAFIGYGKSDSIMMSLGKTYNVPFLKLDSNRYNADWFYDNCHLNPQGDSAKAKEIFNTLIEMNAIKF